MLEPGLVVEVVLVEQRGLHGPQVPRRGPRELLVPLEVHVVLEQHGTEPDVFRELEQVVLALDAREPVELGHERGSAFEEVVLGDDRQPEVDRDDLESVRAIVLGEEVLQCGHDAVARSALGLGVASSG
ncbi:MAG: hypothetical protein U5K30_01895 [Acidimicrobiales bacterium]|nr:hypothetical protein [Acidimicrobiales bacterium]